MSKFAEDTKVSVEKTRAELETTLRRFGADAFGYMTDGSRAAIHFRLNGKSVKFILPLPDRNSKAFTEYTRGTHSTRYARTPEAAEAIWETACRSAWRALFLAVKAKL